MVRNVFLSFVEEDIGVVNLFRGQAKNPSNPLEFSDYSVKVAFDSVDAAYIGKQISELINKASVTLCLIGSNTHTSRWVNWEIRTSRELKKGLVGVRIHSSPSDRAPVALLESGAEIVDWSTQEIVNAIERAARRTGH